MTEQVAVPTIVRYTQRSGGRYVVWSNGLRERWHRGLGTWQDGDHKKQAAASERTAQVPRPVTLIYSGETPFKALNRAFPSGAKYQFRNGRVTVYAQDVDTFLANEDFKVLKG